MTQNDHATRKTILDATLTLLLEKGYTSVTTDLVAARARVSKATIYKYWASKQELEMEATRLRFPVIDVPNLESFEDEVRYVLEARMEHYRQPGMPRLVAGLLGAASVDPVLHEAFEIWVEQFNETINAIVDRGVARGDVRRDISEFAIRSLIAGVVARSVVTLRAFSREATDDLARLIARAVSPGE